MSQQAESTGRALPRRYTSLVTYNDNHPDAAFPPSPAERDALRRFDAAGTGIEDDILDRGMLLTIDFLPGGAPALEEFDRVGTVVASCWGKPPVYVLAEQLSLRAAWRTISAQWPTSLSAVQSALADLRRYGGKT
ncbi:MAG: hypothetical protein AB7E41_00815 [Mycolicibacterium sp.]|uniref:hypothetical protein n=1 Tax=Mycolicibacterium sp. TaxID=2320850 RepID=UPI00355D11BA